MTSTIRSHRLAALVCTALLLLGTALQGQNTTTPRRRFALKTNFLTAINLDVAGEVAYALPCGVGFFVGGGVKDPIVDLVRLGGMQRNGFKSQAWGMYLGASLPFSIHGISGFALKPTAAFSHVYIPNFPTTLSGEIPQRISYVSATIGGFVSLSYTRDFAQRFFAEPVLGLGWAADAFQTSPRVFGKAYLQVPVQLNLGIRF